MSDCLYAHTPAATDKPWPPFLNVSETPTGYTITVRGSAAINPAIGLEDAGPMATIEIGTYELAELYEALGKHLDQVE